MPPKIRFIAFIFFVLSCKPESKEVPQRIYSPMQSYSHGDYYITNDLYYADGFMGTSIGGELEVLKTISIELQMHPEISIQIVPPSEGPFAPAFSHCVWCERAIALREVITEKLDDSNRVTWELDSLPQYIIADGDYHEFKTTVFMVRRGNAGNMSYH